MSDQTPAPAVYTAVIVIKTDEIEGHTYRRGERHHVDATILDAMRDKGMVAPDATAPTGAAG